MKPIGLHAIPIAAILFMLVLAGCGKPVQFAEIKNNRSDSAPGEDDAVPADTNVVDIDVTAPGTGDGTAANPSSQGEGNGVGANGGGTQPPGASPGSTGDESGFTENGGSTGGDSGGSTGGTNPGDGAGYTDAVGTDGNSGNDTDSETGGNAPGGPDSGKKKGDKKQGDDDDGDDNSSTSGDDDDDGAAGGNNDTGYTDGSDTVDTGECEELAGQAMDQVVVSSDKGHARVTVAPDQFLMIVASGEKSHIKINFQDGVDTLAGICIVASGEKSKVWLDHNVNSKKLIYIGSGEKSKGWITVPEGFKVDTLTAKLGGAKAQLKMKGQGEFPCANATIIGSKAKFQCHPQ